MGSKHKDTTRIRGTTPAIEAAARRLRQNMTPAEKKLWHSLEGKQVNGLKFRAQHPIGRFILDFYCPARKLVVELDGGIHKEQSDYDKTRDQHLNEYGLRVIRFRNQEVLEDLPSVLEKIAEMARLLK